MKTMVRQWLLVTALEREASGCVGGWSVSCCWHEEGGGCAVTVIGGRDHRGGERGGMSAACLG
jgi:hypothetical protein